MNCRPMYVFWQGKIEFYSDLFQLKARQDSFTLKLRDLYKGNKFIYVCELDIDSLNLWLSLN